MRSRIAAAGGELTIPATAGAGTCVRGSVPLAQRGQPQTPATALAADE